MTCGLGLLSYLTFLNHADADILANFRVSGTYISSLMNVVRALYGTGLSLAFPIVLWEARENLKKIVFGLGAGNQPGPSITPIPSQGGDGDYSMLDETTSSYDEDQTQAIMSNVAKSETFKVHATLTLGLLFIIGMLGMVITNLEVVFGLVGSTCTPVISYILPALVYIKSGAAAQHHDEIIPKIALGLGVFLVPFGLMVWVLARLSIL